MSDTPTSDTPANDASASDTSANDAPAGDGASTRFANWSRREFLAASGVGLGGLLLGFYLPRQAEAAAADAAFRPNAWVGLDADGAVTVWIGEADMGQGVRTALPQILADEMEADLDRVTLRQAVPSEKFGNLGTGGSSSIRNGWQPMREAGAAARAMLVAAAAGEWGVPAAECTAEMHAVRHTKSGRTLAYGDLAAAAAKQSPPEDPPLKEPKDFRYVGEPMNMLDTPDRVTGEATFGLDVRVENMKFAALARPPVFGSTVASFDADSVAQIEGVEDVFAVDPVGTPVHSTGGVAVVASSTWQAVKAKKRLRAEWSDSEHAGESTKDLRDEMTRLATDVDSGTRVRDDGDVDQAFAEAATTIESTYEMPFLAHATMEPQNCTARVNDDGTVDVWGPIQTPTWTQGSVAEALGVEPQKVRVHTTLLGGGFGRRLNPDVPVEAAMVARQAGQPVQVVWTREDDMRHDFYRPASVHRMRAALDEDGTPTAWHHSFSTPAIRTYINGPDAENPEGNEVPGAFDLPYGFPNMRVEYAAAESGVPRGWWRAVEHSFNGTVINAFMDEVAEAAGTDPLQLRLDMLDAADPKHLAAVMKERYGDMGAHNFSLDRYRRVLEMAAEKAGWNGAASEDGRGRGIAVHWSFRTYCAEVVDVTVRGGELTVDNVVCAVDCGRVVNPNGLEAQMVGGIMNGLMAVLKNEVTVADGRVVEGNFDTYDLLRINEAPRNVEVHAVDSDHVPSGAGEPGLPPLGGALTTAIYDATGQRPRTHPVKLKGRS